MPYIPNTDDDRRIMLERIGVGSFEELLKVVPEGARNREALNLPPALSEPELNREINEIASQNDALVCFAGAGIYDHYVPQAVVSLINRPEFMTAYTPYQPEVAQGTLQVVYEFQTHICRLTGMDVANASMYDGATAAAEATLTAITSTNRKRVILSESLSPMYRDVIRAYAQGFEAEFVTLPYVDGITDASRLAKLADDQTACIVMSQPNFFGCIEDVERLAETIHAAGGLLITAVDPISLGLLKPPGEQGADFVVGEGQPLGIPMSFGGPLVGFYAIKKDYVRKLPGRLVARSKDVDGKTAYTLTLQTREQHIKRSKATSNICTNQALCATAATIYLSLIGKQGLQRISELCLERAHYALERITEIEGFSQSFAQPFHREFVIKCPAPASEVIERLGAKGILAGVDLGRFYPEMSDCLLIAFTEKRSYPEIDNLVEELRFFQSAGAAKQHEKIEEPCA